MDKSAVSKGLAGSFLMVLALPLSGVASDAGAPNRPPREPPPFAYEACQGKKAGDAVEIKGPHGEKFKAVCRERDGRLFAVPERPPGKKRGEGPPPGGLPDGKD
ncbi:MAG: hypothetical protein JXB25_06705 [Deltaproteobacteria bacterium]|nr:hypothetical protein [Deltaproteobacteria bacterium]